MKWKNKGHENDEIGLSFKNKRIVIYGANAYGKDVYNKICFLKSIEGFVDKNEELQRAGVCGLPVYSIKEFAEKDSDRYIVLIAVPGYNGMTIHSQLMHLGYELGHNCFIADIFINYYLPIFSLYSEDNLFFPSISFLLTTRCNLNCIGCLNFSNLNLIY